MEEHGNAGWVICRQNLMSASACGVLTHRISCVDEAELAMAYLYATDCERASVHSSGRF